MGRMPHSDIAAKHDRLVWIDLEMTGLDPERHVIVEVAAVITDGNPGRGHRSGRPRHRGGAGTDGFLRHRDACQFRVG